MIDQPNTLVIRTQCPIKAQNAGLFISRGNAMHPTRIIDSHELIFVKQGELEMWEEDQTFHLKAGRVLHLWPGRRHGSTKLMPPDLKFYWIHFELDPNNNGWEIRSDEDLAPAIKVPQFAQTTQPERLERLFRAFLDDQETGMLHIHAANLLAMLMLVEISQSCQQEIAPISDDANVVATWAHTYIRINFDRPISTSIIAKRLGYSADYLGRIYRQSYGCTLTEAIHQRRIGMACEYLLDSNLSIAQIAQKCGYTDPGYFRRIFRRQQQIPPSEFRRKYSHMHVNTH